MHFEFDHMLSIHMVTRDDAVNQPYYC